MMNHFDEVSYIEATTEENIRELVRTLCCIISWGSQCVAHLLVKEHEGSKLWAILHDMLHMIYHRAATNRSKQIQTGSHRLAGCTVLE